MTFRSPTDYGPMLENIVYMHLRRRGDVIKYIKTNGREINFLTTQKNTGEKELIQVCWDLNTIETLKGEIRGIKSALLEYNIPTGTIVTWDDEIELLKEIQIIPVWKWLLV
jgi:predicted AAA+ superfamily ATPase